jgi:hypothetical protein
LRRRLYLSWFLLHFSLILAVSFHAVFQDLALGMSWLSPFSEQFWKKGEMLTEHATGTFLKDSNPIRQVTTLYLYSAGIPAGYGYFAPNIPNSTKLVFELHYDDGRVEYELPHVNDTGAGLRLITLLDYVGQTDYEPLRQLMVKMLAFSLWQRHPDASSVRAVYGYINEPTPAEAKQGATEDYHLLYTYDFKFR